MYAWLSLFCKDPDFGAYNSPTLGNKVTVTVPVTLAVANGEIGFQSVQPITVDEPKDTPYSVSVIDWQL